MNESRVNPADEKFLAGRIFWNPIVGLKESTAVGACCVPVFTRDNSTMLCQDLLSPSCTVGSICSSVHIDIARKP